MKRALRTQLETWHKKPNRKPLLLRGARQVGKTHILQEFGKTSFRKVHYLDFERETRLGQLFGENLDPKSILEELSVLNDTDIKVDQDLLILDEIQACPRALTSLKYFHQDLPSLAICSAGSLLGVTLSDSSFPVGKIDLMDLYPLNFFEFLDACGHEKIARHLRSIVPGSDISEALHHKIWRLLKLYFVVGGLPEIVKVFSEQQGNLSTALQNARQNQKTLLSSYLVDIAKHSGKINSMHIERLWRNVPTQLGRDINSGSKKFVFKDAVAGLRGYDRLAGVIDWLTQAGLVLRAPIINKAALPFSAYAKENVFKLFLFDVGMLGALSDLPPASIMAYDYGNFKGYFAENFVLQELTAMENATLYCWKEKESEVEFLQEFDGEVTPIEVKSGLSTKTRSLKVYLEKYAPKHAFILSGKPGIHLKQHKKDHQPTTSLWSLPLYTASILPNMLKPSARM